MRFEAKIVGIASVHLQPRIRRHALENRDLARLGARVPVLHGTTSVEDERKLLVRLLRKRRPVNAEEPGLAVFGLKVSVGVKAGRAYCRRPFRERPLDSVMFFDEFVGQARIVAKASLRNALPFVECMLGLGPSRK